jgi:ubiquinone/menaquinone biosynthesis C-methylase UbiE
LYRKKGGLTIILNPREVKHHFARLDSWDSERDTEDPNLRALNRRQRLDIPNYLTIIDFVMLDAGCGDGRIMYDLTKQGASQVVGVDISSHVLSKTRVRIGDAPSHFIQGDIDWLPLRTSIFHATTCFDILVHMPNPGQTLTEITRTLRSGGTLAVNTTNSNPLWRLTFQGNPWKFIKDLFLYNSPSSLVRLVTSLLGRQIIGRHMTESYFRALVEENLIINELLTYGESPPVYYVAIATKQFEDGTYASG